MYIQSVGIVVRNQEGLVWAGARADQEDWCWQFPQGTIETGESPEEAAKRELWEETGIQASVFAAQSSSWQRYDYPATISANFTKRGVQGKEQLWFLYLFEGNDEEINITHHAQEFKAWKWMTAEELLEVLVPFKKPIIEQALREFGFVEKR